MNMQTIRYMSSLADSSLSSLWTVSSSFCIVLRSSQTFWDSELGHLFDISSTSLRHLFDISLTLTLRLLPVATSWLLALLLCSCQVLDTELLGAKASELNWKDRCLICLMMFVYIYECQIPVACLNLQYVSICILHFRYLYTAAWCIHLCFMMFRYFVCYCITQTQHAGVCRPYYFKQLGTWGKGWAEHILVHQNSKWRYLESTCICLPWPLHQRFSQDFPLEKLHLVASRVSWEVGLSCDVSMCFFVCNAFESLHKLLIKILFGSLFCSAFCNTHDWGCLPWWYIHSTKSIEIHWNHPFLAASALFLILIIKSSGHLRTIGSGYHETWENWNFIRKTSDVTCNELKCNSDFQFQIWSLWPLSALLSRESSWWFQLSHQGPFKKFKRQAPNKYSTSQAWSGGLDLLFLRIENQVPCCHRWRLGKSTKWICDSPRSNRLPSNGNGSNSTVRETRITTTHHPPPTTTHPPATTTHHHPRPEANLSNYFIDWIWSEKMLILRCSKYSTTFTAAINVITLLLFTFTNFPSNSIQMVLSSFRASILCNVPWTIGAVLGYTDCGISLSLSLSSHMCLSTSRQMIATALKESHTSCGSNELSTKDSWSATLKAREGHEYQSKTVLMILDPQFFRAMCLICSRSLSSIEKEIWKHLDIQNFNAPQRGLVGSDLQNNRTK